MSVFKRWNGTSWETIGPQISSARFDDTNHMIAPEYSSTSTYNVGDYVVQNDKLYKCISAIESAEEWTAAHWTATKISAALNDLSRQISDTKSALNDISEANEVDETLTLSNGYYISSADGQLKPVSSQYGVSNAVDVTDYIYLLVSGSANYGNLIYAFYDSNGDFVSGKAGSNDGTVLRIQDELTKVPSTATTFVVAYTAQSHAGVTGIKGYNVKTDKTLSILNYPADAKVVGDKFSEFFSKKSVTVKYEDCSKGICSPTTGAIYSNNSYRYTVIDLNGVSDIVYNGKMQYNGAAVAVFRDSNEDVVSVFNIGTNTLETYSDLAIPIDYSASDVVICWYLSAGVGQVEYKQSILSVKYKWGTKNWTVVGDSLTEVNTKTTKHYFDYIAENTGISVHNMGVSGSGYKNQTGSGTDAFYQRISNVPLDSDVITIFGSFNDLDGNPDLGTKTDSGTTTIAGCINTTLDNLFTAFPLANIGIVTPCPWETANPTTEPNSASAYVDMIKAICDMRSIPCLDLFHCSGLRPWDSTFKALAYTKDGGSGTHPDETGHFIISTKFEAFLDELLLH